MLQISCNLPNSSSAFVHGRNPVLMTIEFRMSEGDASKGLAYNVSGCGPAILAEVKARLWIYIGIGPAVQDDAGDIFFCFEPCI